MIYVNQDQLDQVHYLLEQSAIGNHLLFSVEAIKQFADPEFREPGEKLRLENGEKLMEQMIMKPNLTLKKAFLESLDQHSFEDVARVYLNIVHNTAKETQAFKH